MIRLLYLLIPLMLIVGCQNPSAGPTEDDKKQLRKADHKLFHATLRKHLQATASKDLATLTTMMAPDGLMHLIRPGTEVVYTTDKYLKYHESWFSDDKWTIKTTITDSEVGTDMGIAIVELMYSVPEKDGKPYWNKMTISYTLKKYEDNAWYVIADHSSSVKKSTD